MTVSQAREIVQRYSVTNWPFSRLTQDQLKELEKAYKVIRQHEIDKLGEGRF